MSNEPTIDIRPDHMEMVRKILWQHVPDREVWAFGSRVTWIAKAYSDLDLVIMGEEPMDLDVLAALKEDFSTSDLPWKVDVVEWASTAASFRTVIEKKRVVVQKTQSLPVHPQMMIGNDGGRSWTNKPSKILDSRTPDQRARFNTR